MTWLTPLLHALQTLSQSIITPTLNESLPPLHIVTTKPHTPSTAAVVEKKKAGPLDMASEETEKKIADAEEEEDKTPPRTSPLLFYILCTCDLMLRCRRDVCSTPYEMALNWTVGH